MRVFFNLLLLLAVLITTGCTSDNTATLTITPEPVPVTSAVPTTTPTPVPQPEEMAYLENVKCGVDQTTGTAYHCSGKVRIKSGVYDEVQVIARYPDKNTFNSPIVAMGGSDPVLRNFIIFPDFKYQDQSPLYLVKLDKTLYPVTMFNESGTAYSNTVPVQAVVTPGPVVKSIVADPGTPQKPTMTTTLQPSAHPGTTTTPVWVPTVSGINPAVGYPDKYRGFIIEGWDFRQDPPPKVYLRRQGSSCEFCGVQATDVRVTTPTTLQCLFDLSGEASGPASYDILVTNSNLTDSYGILRNGLTIMEHTPVPTQETLATP